MDMKFAKHIVMAFVSLLIALVLAQPGFAYPAPAQPVAILGVNLGFAPNPVSAGSQTQIQISVSGGAPPYFLWFNGTIPGCSPSQQPIQQNQSSASYPCNPSSPGSFGAHLDVADNMGDHGSASATLTVQSGGGGTGGSGSGSNQTGGIDLSFLQNLLPVLMITGILFLASTVAIAVSAVALAILVPRRLKQLRKAIEGQPMKKPEPVVTKAETPKEQPPANEL